MFLKKVTVPHFRVLQEVALQFHPEFTPSVFPLGSLNGGGKSTLLQLIFVLLHCSFEEERHHYLSHFFKNLAENTPEQATIASFELVLDNKEFCLEFVLYYEPLKQKTENSIYITHIKNEKFLLCKTKEPIDFLKQISSKVYLATPSTQILLFLPEKARKQLFNIESHQLENYHEAVNIAKKELLGLFCYDFASPAMILSALKKERDKDFQVALKKSGEYGENLKNLLAELNYFLPTVTIGLTPDFSSVTFTHKNTERELYPEDLSHGELKKLGIYLWFRTYEIKDSLVLMDEIEIGLHPDWQYEIVNELQEWSSGNQFILATHSYELCQAVTPKHVSELEPKLLTKQTSTN